MKDDPILIDAHSHIDGYEDKILEQVLAEIAEHRIFTLSTSMSIPSYEKTSRIGEACGWILPAFGIHPWHAMEYVDRLEALNPCIEKSPIIGEIGLDYYYVSNRASYPAQRKVFAHLLAAARDQNKIVNLHTKGAERDVLSLLGQYKIKRAIVHWYSGPFDAFDALVDLGAYFTVGPEIAHSSHIRAIAKDIPLNRLLTETDNPGGMKWLDGKPGMPVQITGVLDILSALLDMPLEDVIGTVASNFARLIEDDPGLSGIYAKFFKPR